MHRHLIDLVERLASPTVCVVGDLILDQYVYGDAERISPEAPIPVLRVSDQREDFRLGGAGCVANNLRELGATVALFGVTGDDDRDRRLRGMLAERGMGAAARTIVRIPGRATTLKTRFIGAAQHHNQQQVLRVDWEEATPIPRPTEKRLLAAFRRRLSKARAVVLSDYQKGVATPALCQAVIRAAARRRIPVLVDPHPGADYASYAGAHLITPNRYEAEKATGIAVRSAGGMRRAARALAERYGFRAVLITLDKEGSYLLETGGRGQPVPTRPRQVYDNAGAGDMVMAVMAWVLASGGTALEAAQLANVAAGLEVMKPGVQTVSRREIVADLLGQARGTGDKRRTLHDLLGELAQRRASGQAIVFTNGCFDLIHPGHIRYFDFAASQGDCLVVGLNTDRSVRRLKGPGRPVCREDDRARVLAGLEAVDYIVLFDEDTPERLLRAIRPDVLVKGEDWRTKGVVGQKFVESYGGRVALAPLVKGHSTTTLVRRIRQQRR